MEDNKAMRRNLIMMTTALVFLLAMVLLEAAALWYAGRFWQQAKWTAAECTLLSLSYCLVGIVSVSRIRKQATNRSLN